MNIKLRVWRQEKPNAKGRFVVYDFPDADPNMSFLEMMDALNNRLVLQGEEPVAFDHDCREGICGACSAVIGGKPHGPGKRITTCQAYVRAFREGDVITVEPFRARAFPVLKDLVVDRSALDRIVQAGGFVSVSTGSAPEANAIPVAKEVSDKAFDAAACIGCGACVATCKNASATLFVAAKISHLGWLPQGQAERSRRALNMVEQMGKEGFGSCSNTLACEAVCPKGISATNIARMNRDFAFALVSRAGQ